MIETRAQVERISPLTDSIIELVLRPDHYVEYEAGQYLQISSGGDYLSYSIANAPLGSHKYELHIRHESQNVSNQALFHDIKQQGAVSIRVPLGDCHLTRLDLGMPIIFLAAGTGFAPIKAMIEQLLATGDPRSFELYWGARTQSDLYYDGKVQHWVTHSSRFRYFSLLPTGNTKDKLATQVIHHHPHDLSGHQFVMAGPFDMVFATRDELLDAGVSLSRMYSDAFGFIPS